MHGLPGVGKSDCAAYLAFGLEGSVLNTNDIREHVMQLEVYKKREDGKMPFTREQLDLSYRIMYWGAGMLIKAHVPAILDATFHHNRLVEEAKQLAYEKEREAYRMQCS